MILEVTARLVLRSNFAKIVRIWIGALDLEPKSVGGDAWAAIQARSHILSFSDLNKTPHILPTTLQWGCGEGVASAFLSFSGRRRGRGTVIGQCGEGLGLSNSPVSGKSYIEGRYNPRNRACDKELKHQTDRRLCLGISTENFSAWRNLYLRWKNPPQEKPIQIVRSLQPPSSDFSLVLFSCVPVHGRSGFLVVPSNLEPASPNQSPYKWCLVCSLLPNGITSAKLSTLMSGGRGRVIGRIREDIPGKGLRWVDGAKVSRRRWRTRQTCLGIFCNKKGNIDQQVTSLPYILLLKEETLTSYLLVQHNSWRKHHSTSYQQEADYPIMSYQKPEDCNTGCFTSGQTNIAFCLKLLAATLVATFISQTISSNARMLLAM